MLLGRRAALAATVAVLFGTGLFVAFGGDAADVQISKEIKTRLYVRTVPAGAEIKLDGAPRGATNRLFVVPPGVRRMTVEVELEGYGKERRVVEIEGGRIERVEFRFDEPPEVTGPGSPQSALAAAPAGAQDAVPAGARGADLGAAIERVVQDDKTGKDWLMDLDTGRLYTPPRELDPEQNREADHKELEAWTIRQGIDLSGIKAGTGTLYGLDLQVAVMSGRGKPGKVSREEVLRALEDPAARVTAKPQGSVLVTRLEKRPDGDAYAFKSREGSVGILEILDTTDDGRGVKIHCRLLENDTARSIRDRVTNPPEGWKVLESFIVNADQTAAIARKLGGRISKLSNTIFSVGGQRVQINVFECATPADADKVHKAVLDTKGHPAYCLRLGNVLVEFVGEFDVEFAKRAARELGIGPESAEENVRAVVRQFIEAVAEGNETATARLIEGRLANKVSQCQVDDMIEFIEPVLTLDKIDQVFLTGDRALVVTEAARLKDPKYGVVCAVYLLVRQEGRWTIRDMDLEDEKGLPRKIERFRDPDAATSIDNDNSLIESRVLRQEFGRLLADAVAARLDFRIAPTRTAGGPGTLKPEQVERYIKQFQDDGKSPQLPVAWFECDGDIGSQLITAKDASGRQFVLLSTEPDETMLAVEEGRTPWGLTRVMVEKGPNGQPAVGVEFDAEGARRFAGLTSNHLKQPLAMLVNGKVVYAPTIQSTVSKRAIITGRFSEQDIERMVKSLIKGMVHP